MNGLVERVKPAVQSWREEDYKGASVISKRLLQFWFLDEHVLRDGNKFEFWHAQREAIEALIYVYEVCGYRSLYEMARGFGVSAAFDPTADNWPKYCFKMATGSGKTFVMAVAIVWQFFNDFFQTQNGPRYASKFLVIAPNLIVLDRLNEAFANKTIFKEFPFVPPDWSVDFDLQMVFQSGVTPQRSRAIFDEAANVEVKAQAGLEWCEKVTELTSESWAYAKILQDDFERLSHLPASRLLQEAGHE